MLSPALLLISFLLLPFSRKLRRGLFARKGLLNRADLSHQAWKADPLWFHVSSSGEFEQCLPILDELKARGLLSPIILTFFSPSGLEALTLEKKRREQSGQQIPWDFADYSPLDFKSHVDRFIKIMRPRALILIHGELWPQLISSCQKMHIPCLLMGSFVSHFSWWRKLYYSRALSAFQFIGTIDPETASQLKKLSLAADIEVVGDSRVERVLQRKQRNTKAPWESFFEGQKIFLFASIHKRELKFLLPTYEWLAKSDFRILTVLHEPTPRLARRVKACLDSKGISCRLWSHWLYSPDATSHLIVDTVGTLAELYKMGQLVFVGGSFDSRVHNILEPAAYGRPILTGPLIENSSEAIYLSKNNLGLIRVFTPEALVAAVKRLQSSEEVSQLSSRLIAFVQGMRGAHIRYADKVWKHLSLFPDVCDRGLSEFNALRPGGENPNSLESI